jgi:hypothetical protein
MKPFSCLSLLAVLAACQSPVTSTPLVSTAFRGAAANSTPATRSAPAGDRPSARVAAGIEVGAGGDSVGSIVTVEGESPLGDKISIAPRVMRYDYSWEGEGDFTDNAEEDGDGVGIGAEIRFYPQNVLDGFYVGAGAAVFPASDWEYRDGSTVETGDDTSFTAYGSAGYMFNLGERFFIGPTAIVGSYVSDSPESGFYGGVGLRFGINF